MATCPLLDDVEPYRRLVGRLVYLAVTQPDLSNAVHMLSRFLHQPRQEHWSAALRVVRYLKGSPGQGVLFRADSSLSITGWCDSDWGGCPTSRRSVTGWFILLGGSPISWKTKKQLTVSLSSAEAEYRSMANIVCELKWLKGLLASLGVIVPLPMHVLSDSKSAIVLAHNPVFHERTKHIEIDCHFMPDAITDGLMTTTHVSTTEQLADIFTKALGAPQFIHLLAKLGTLDLHAPA
ncbi:secreted RxLR effector protein 161-like [Silene latifolia]|uniref:secreted RxLR effector protein 161-like n=1 Tax=Silene latifolia TaxID=37657 RepID=UPI003D78ACAF